MDESHEKRFEAIERRLLALEQRAANPSAQGTNATPISSFADPVPSVLPPPPPPLPHEVEPSFESAFPDSYANPDPVLAGQAAADSESRGYDETVRNARNAERQRLRDEADRVWNERLQRAKTAPAIDWTKIERLVAGRWYSLAGGLVVTIGVALFVQYAVKQGWLGQIPGWARCAMGGMLGVVLLCAGECTRRKVTDWASVGLTVAGLGSLYISSYAAYALYQLMTPSTTLLVLAGVAGIGLSISAFTNLSVVGLVSMIGAYLAPFIASSSNAGYVYLPLYWLALLVVGQLLSLIKGDTFAICRWLGAVATLLFGAGWIMKFAGESPWIGLAMLGSAWALFHAESAWTATRVDRLGIAEMSEADLPRLLESPIFFSQATNLRLRPLISVSASAWASSLGVYAARESHFVPESLAPGVVGALAFILACVLVRPSGILNPRPTSKRQRLAAALCATAGTLLVATVAIAFSGFAQTIALTAIGLAALATGRWLRTQVLDIYSGLVLLFAAGRVLCYDSWATAPNAPGFELLGFYLTEWTAACAGIGAAWIVYAVAISRPRQGNSLDGREPATDFIPASWLVIATNFGLGLGIVLIGSSLLHQRAAHESVACAILATALAFAFTAGFRRSAGLRIASIVTLVIATACTLCLTWWVRRSEVVNLVGLALVPQMLVALTNGIVAIVIAWTLNIESWRWSRVAKIMTGLGVVLFVLGVSHTESSATSLCYAWLAIGWACLLATRLAIGFAFEAHALWVWLIVLGTWGSKFAAENWAGSTALPLLHPGLWIAFALAGTILAIHKLSKPILVGMEAKAKAIGWWAATTLILISTSLEVARLSSMLPIDTTARGAAVSIWWGMFAVLLLVVGFWRNIPLVRRCGLGLLAIATGKALVIDLARVAPGWRAISVVSLGLLMVAVGVVYSRIAKSLLSGNTDDTTEPETNGTSGETQTSA